MERYLQGARIQSSFNKDLASIDKQKSLASTFNESQTNSSGNFDCNICLDLVQEPVVTFCGHLYCWPCIYKWISTYRATSLENSDLDQTECPVCKAEVSEKTLIPLYGRGGSELKDKEDSLIIPQRPRCDGTISRRNYVPPYNYSGDDVAPLMIRLGGRTTPHLVDPRIGMFGEMVYARFFGNSESELYSYTNNYGLEGTRTSRRLRRYVMEADKSLSRMCFFLCCCVMLCLFLF